MHAAMTISGNPRHPTALHGIRSGRSVAMMRWARDGFVGRRREFGHRGHECDRRRGPCTGTPTTPWIVTMAARAGSVRFGDLRYLPPSTFPRP